MTIWQAVLIALGGAAGIIIFIMLICYGYVAYLKIKGRKK